MSSLAAARPLELLNPLDVTALQRAFREAEPFPHVAIQPFLREEFAREVAAAFPRYRDAAAVGRAFQRVTEARKVQVTDASRFPEPVRRLHELLASPAFLATIEEITGIPSLRADPALTGGGMHVMGSGARLDVHVDFNRLPDAGLYRRLNILVFLNEAWDPAWGGEIELWDRKVAHRVRAYEPSFNRCVVFETSEISFHGVAPVRSPAATDRRSFAAYYYTREAPETGTGELHSTIFRARPDEPLRRFVLLPFDRARRGARRTLRRIRYKLGRPPSDP